MRGTTTSVTSRGRRRRAVFTFGLGAIALVAAPAASAQTVNVVSSSTAMTSTTHFTTTTATAGPCPTGTTLVGGGARITLNGADTPNNGAVIDGVFPSGAAAGTLSNNGDAGPAFWTANAPYSGQAPGTDTVTSYAMCTGSTAVASATQVVVNTMPPATTGTTPLGPLTATCPAGTTLVGGGGGYQVINTGVNMKLASSYPSDAGGTLMMANPTSWTVLGNSNPGIGPTLTVDAICATDASPSIQVVTNNVVVPNAGSGQTVAATATCPAGTTLLSGGMQTDTGAQHGTHVIGDYPTDSSGNEVTTGSADSWTTKAQAGGIGTPSLGTTAIALCNLETQPMVPEATYPALMVGIGALLGGGFLARQRRLAPVSA